MSIDLHNLIDHLRLQLGMGFAPQPQYEQQQQQAYQPPAQTPIPQAPASQELPPIQAQPSVPVQQLPLTSAPAAAPAPDSVDGGSDGPIATVTGSLPPRGFQPSNPLRLPLAPPAPVVTNGQGRDLGNRAMIESAEAAEKNSPDHKGMFGVHGTLRNVLGLLGDSLLVGAGRQAIYRPQTESEKQEDAYAGATSNDQGALDAAERLAHAGDVKDALALQQHVQLNQYHRDNLASLDSSRQSASSRRNSLDFRDASRLASNYAAEAGNDPAKQAVAAQRIAVIAQRNGLQPEDLGIHEGMTSDEWQTIAGGGSTPFQQAQIEALPIRLQQGQQNADANTTRAGAAVTSAGAADYRAHHPSGGSHATHETELEAVTDAANTPPEKQTPAQKLILRRYQYGTKGPGIADLFNNGGASAPATPSGAKRTFRIVGVRNK